MAERYQDREVLIVEPKPVDRDSCPDCHQLLSRQGGCDFCCFCGFSLCD